MVDIEASFEPSRETKAEVESLSGASHPGWHSSLNRDQDRPAWFLARHEGRLVAYLTIFDPTGTEAEVSAYVVPGLRRQGVFRSLWAEARRQWQTPDRRWLIVADRSDREGTAMAAQWGTLALTETTLVLTQDQRPSFPGLPPGLTLTVAGMDDLEDALAILSRSHGESPQSYREFLIQVVRDPQRRLHLLYDRGRPVATAGLHLDEGTTTIFALAVDPESQGRGWGRALVLALMNAVAPETKEYLIEVDSLNSRAEGLYRSLGFRDIRVTDYYEVERCETDQREDL